VVNIAIMRAVFARDIDIDPDVQGLPRNGSNCDTGTLGV
jgi:hypothetical protein